VTRLSTPKNIINVPIPRANLLWCDSATFIAIRAPPSVHRALEIFETINERGVGLSPLDLLKNQICVQDESGNSEIRTRI